MPEPLSPLSFDERLAELARKLGFNFEAAPLDVIRPPERIAERKAAELKLFLTARAAAAQQDARGQLLGETAFAGAAPTPQETAAYKPGQPFAAQTRAVPTPGPEGTVDPGLEAELQSELRAEELDRAAGRNAPAIAKAQRQLLMKDAGFDLANVALARLREAHAGMAETRGTALGDILGNPDLDPLLGADIAQNKAVFKPQRVKVKRRDGKEVYYDVTPNLAGGHDYQPALDESGEPLQVPTSAAGNAPTALQKNTRFLAGALFAGDPDAVEKAATLLTQLKGKSPGDAWESLVREVSKMNFGRYARDPQRLYQKTAEIWRVARPNEPLPMEAPLPAPAAPTTTAEAAKPRPVAAAQADGFPRVQSDADYLKLPSGARFMGPDGKLRRKP